MPKINSYILDDNITGGERLLISDLDGSTSNMLLSQVSSYILQSISLTETDPIFVASVAASITNTNITNWNTAFGWGDHSTEGYLTSVAIGDVTGFTDNSSNWNTAFGWGDHASGGYLTSESDPVFTASDAAAVTAAKIANWDTAFGWGDHGTQGYLTSVDISDINTTGTASSTTYLRGDGQWTTVSGGGTDNSLSEQNQTIGNSVTRLISLNNFESALRIEDSTNSIILSMDEANIAFGFLPFISGGSLTPTISSQLTSKSYVDGLVSNSSNWNTAFGWGDHSSAGYLTSYAETDPIFLASDAAAVTAAKIANWDTAFGWGDHGTQGYLTSVDISDINTTGTASSTTYLRGDGQWTTVSGGGTDDQNANEVPFSPYLTLTSTDVQSTIEELKDEVDNISVGGISAENQRKIDNSKKFKRINHSSDFTFTSESILITVSPDENKKPRHIVSGTNNVVFTVPSIGTVGEDTILVQNLGTGTVRVRPDTGQTFIGNDGSTNNTNGDFGGTFTEFTIPSFATVSLYKSAANEWFVDGNFTIAEPTQTLGAEQVVNGTFDTDTDWTKQGSATISGGVGNIVGAGNIAASQANMVLYQDNVWNTAVSENVRVTFDARLVSGTGDLQMGQRFSIIHTQTLTTTMTTYTFDHNTETAQAAWDWLSLGCPVGTTIEIDNISVREIL